MKTLYCAVSYICNERCIFCPCSEEGGEKMPSLTWDEIRSAIDIAIERKQIDNVLLSGGEPTLHPCFFDIIEYINKKKLMIGILTNAIKLSDMHFVDRLMQVVNPEKLDVTIAFHSHISEKHDALTQHRNSYQQSLQGAQNLIKQGVRLSVKNNIVNYTYQDLPDYIDWVNETFPERVTLLLANIDVNGVALRNKERIGVHFSQSMPFLTQALDKVIEARKRGLKRNVKVLTTPLCLIDPYYWGFIENQTHHTIEAYLVPAPAMGNPVLYDVSSGSGPLFNACQECAVNSYCPGAWQSFKDVYDESILKRIYAE